MVSGRLQHCNEASVRSALKGRFLEVVAASRLEPQPLNITPMRYTASGD